MTDRWNECQLPDDLPFDGWVNYVFDHPVLEPQWWWQDVESGYQQHWNEKAQPSRALRYMTKLFTEPGFLVERFSRPQIDQGLNFIVSNSCSSHMFALRDASIDWPERRACFDAMIPLYAKLMAPVYGNDLGHLDDGTTGRDRPTFACYMWWDIIPLYGGMEHPDRDRINDAVLNVFEEVLTLKAESCLESVLHGLGHWHLDVPDRTEPIVRNFVQRDDISPELRQYAMQASVGGVQ